MCAIAFVKMIASLTKPCFCLFLGFHTNWDTFFSIFQESYLFVWQLEKIAYFFQLRIRFNLYPLERNPLNPCLIISIREPIL